MANKKIKTEFIKQLKGFANSLTEYVSTKSGEWKIKGFIDAEKNIYNISNDSKLISKILEIQLYPKFKEFAEKNGYEIIFSRKKWQPDMSFFYKKNLKIKFAIDLKSTYRRNNYPGFCKRIKIGNLKRFTTCTEIGENKHYPYLNYKSHFVIGIIYSKFSKNIFHGNFQTLIDDKFKKSHCPIYDFQFFVQENWKIASDKVKDEELLSINYIPKLIKGKGIFVKLGKDIFNQFWINRNKMMVRDLEQEGRFVKMKKVSEYVDFLNKDRGLINQETIRIKI